VTVIGIPHHQCPPHHWMLGDAEGEVCHATCKRCRVKKDFAACCDKDRLGKPLKLAKRVARVRVDAAQGKPTTPTGKGGLRFTPPTLP
jgi:hypothetical protein